MELLKKTPYISGGNFQSLQNKRKPTLKTFLIFWEMELSSPKKLNNKTLIKLP